jgi:nitrite reductase/ring-hydroxylating ferredoxin subunit
MSLNYAPVLWNRQKKIYDLILWVFIIVLMALFSALELSSHPNVTAETLIIRATAFTAIVLLHIILLIGPLARLDSRLLPILYNRRHLGVSMFIVSAVHGVFSILQFHSLSDTNAIVSVFISNQNYTDISQLPFQILGFLALVIFFFMAITSHDFWLKNLSPKVWKGLHMLVYVAYGLVIIHVALGTLQYEDSLFYKVLLMSGFAVITGLHIYTGKRENKKLKSYNGTLTEAGYVKVCLVDEIVENRAKSVFIKGQNIAIFKYDGKVSAVNNVCKHQMGPLGEGKVVEGCITCPWHGYQYYPHNGQSPAPFEEKVSTYKVKVVDAQIWVNPTALEEGEEVKPARV